ncbi:MAG TPA: aspartate aminotransferase family protein [Mycobacteriales bacterium]|nr:aspartate aminotransferase family protein [Mycobacteriales bacterium]
MSNPPLPRFGATEVPVPPRPDDAGPRITWTGASGTRVWDDAGRQYLDLTAGAGAATVGHCHPKVVEAVRRQAGELIHTGRHWGNRQRVDLVGRLRGLLPGGLDAVFLAVTGTEAVEVADRLARLHTGRRTVLSFQGGYHGKTAGALRLSTQRDARHGVLDRTAADLRLYYPNANHCPLGGRHPDGCDLSCLDLNEGILRHPDFDRADVAAIIVEPVQGVAGMVAPPAGFLPRLRSLCDEIGALLVVDEIYTGFGRTGRTFAVEHSAVTPDIMVMGKALGGGLPISAVAARPAIADSMEPVAYGGTFAGNPLSCAAGLAVLDILDEEKLAANAGLRGAFLAERLTDLAGRSPGRIAVSGLGLMLGLEIDPADPESGREPCRRIARAALERGVLVFTGGTYRNCLKLTPPLVLDEEDCERAVTVLTAAVDEVLGA